MQLYRMELVAQKPINNGDAVTWLFRWWRIGERRVQDSIVYSSITEYKPFAYILDAYRAGVHWAALQGPDDLCHQVIALDGKGY